jgi:hypothetical protein
MPVQFPLEIDEHIAKKLLSGFEKKELETWRSLYT